MKPPSRADEPLFASPVVPGILLVALVGLSLSLYADFIVDDTYITLRYSRHVAEGRGPVFNPGERVEGYTNLLWMLVMVVPYLLGLDPVLTARILGGLGLGLVLEALWDRGDEVAGRRGGILAALFVAGYAGCGLWAMSGMETMAYTACLTLGLLRARSGGLIAEALLTGAALIRPDGLWFLGLYWVGSWWFRGERPRFSPAVLLAVTAWRWSYYGDIVPNTFHAKVGAGVDQAVRGLIYLKGFSASALGHGFLLLAIGGAASGRHEPAVRGLLAALLPYLAYVVFVGGDPFPMYRFLVPVFPLLALLAARGTADLLTRAPPSLKAPLAYGLAAALALFSHIPHQDHIQRDRGFTVSFEGLGRTLGRWADPDWSLAVIPAGAVPYFSRLETIDMLGLNDRTIARTPVGTPGLGTAGHERSNTPYLMSRRPTILYTVLEVERPPSTPLKDQGVTSIYTGDFLYPAIVELWESQTFQAAYAERYVPNPWNRYWVIFVRKDSEALTRPFGRDTSTEGGVTINP